MKKEDLKKKIDEMWQVSKKDMEKVLKNAEMLAKKGEGYLKDKSAEGKTQLEIASLALQREKLYYELGKTLAKAVKTKWSTDKKALEITAKIKNINIEIKKKKKKK